MATIMTMGLFGYDNKYCQYFLGVYHIYFSICICLTYNLL